MYVDYTADVAIVTAARAGDRQALDKLVRHCLPLVYNIAGRALDGHIDVDDVVQETMLQVVRGLESLHRPESFRSWMVAIAMQKVRERWRSQQTRTAVGIRDELSGTADPAADFVDVTILRLGLSGQRREVAEATRWLEADERELLSLWWLETAGQLTREELATVLDLTPAHAAVRVQRMKARLDTARAVVRALRSSPPCADLMSLTSAWDGVPAAVWRKRISRHIRQCPTCSQRSLDLVPAEGLLAGIALVPLPAGFATSLLYQAGTPHAAAAHAVGAARRSSRSGLRVARIGRHLTAKPMALVTAGALVLGGAAAAGYGLDHGTAPPPATAAPATPSATPTAAQHPTSPAPPVLPSPTAPRPSLMYGQTVDQVDSAPAPDARPAPLPERRQAGPVAMSGSYAKPEARGTYLLAHRGEYLTISGRGYFMLDWQVEYFTRGPGQIQMPTWTGLKGKLFHVASGGGHRMDDTWPWAPHGHTWMGEPGLGYSTVPQGAQQMWQNEYYYLDGTVTLHLNERGTDYNLIVGPTTRTSIIDDITQPPSPVPANGRARYGLVRDTGADDTPVPQYLTRDNPADPTSLPQRSRVEAEQP
jgi:RNA polymerase sigma factor (sigma-70 family)